MGRYRKKPVVVEAVRVSWENWSELCELVGKEGFDRGVRGVFLDADGNVSPGPAGRIGVVIPTPEGTMLAQEGDWLIKGVVGELYPCKDEVFQITYEPDEPSTG